MDQCYKHFLCILITTLLLLFFLGQCQLPNLLHMYVDMFLPVELMYPLSMSTKWKSKSKSYVPIKDTEFKKWPLGHRILSSVCGSARPIVHRSTTVLEAPGGRRHMCGVFTPPHQAQQPYAEKAASAARQRLTTQRRPRRRWRQAGGWRRLLDLSVMLQALLSVSQHSSSIIVNDSDSIWLTFEAMWE